MTSHTFTNTAQLAERIETTSSDVVGCGLAAKPISRLSQDAVSKAMLTAMRNPTVSGKTVDQVRMIDGR